MKVINGMKDLERAMQPVLVGMVNEMTDRVYQTLNYFLLDYYNGYDPSSYRRRYDFLHSAVKVNAKVKGNKVIGYVYIDTDYMDNYYSASGEQVVEWANTGLHGGREVDHKPHVWDDTIENTVDNGELLRLAIAYLKSKGFSVRI